MFSKPPTIPDGTVLEYFPGGTLNGLFVDSTSPGCVHSWMCYIEGSLPLERGEKVTVFKKTGLFSGSKFRCEHRGGSTEVNLVEKTDGPPTRN